MPIILKELVCCFTFFLVGAFAFSQEEIFSLTDQDRREIVMTVAQKLEDHYVLKETGVEYSCRLRHAFDAGEYDKITSPEKLSQHLQDDLRKIYPDGHLSVFYDPSFYAILQEREQLKDTSRIIDLEFERRHNGGFKEVRVLEGNIGYLKLDGFMYLTENTKRAADHALGFLSNSNSLIIDLRDNLGGSPTMIQHLLNYFFKEPTHYNTFYERLTNTISEKRTVPLPSSAFTETPLYILTSKRSFSAAEEFAYDLQQLDRGLVIGESTGGGAHPVRPFSITKGFIVNIPYAMAINPISNTNWEGTGVSPDVSIEAEKALYKAIDIALNRAISTATSEEASAWFEWHRKRNSTFLEPIILPEGMLKDYLGTYGEINIYETNGNLIYTSSSHPMLAGTFKLVPISASEFLVEDVEDLNLNFEKDENGNITSLKLVWQDGRSRKFPKKKVKSD